MSYLQQYNGAKSGFEIPYILCCVSSLLITLLTVPLIGQPTSSPSLAASFTAQEAQGSGQYTPPPPPPPPPPEAPPPVPPGPMLTPEQLDSLVARIALYPDPLLAHILVASTFWSEIPEAAEWANANASLHGYDLADAIRADNLPWNPAVIALLPFPSILNMMARDMSWTQQLGTAVLNQRGEVMDAVQRLRREALNYGYLQSNPYFYIHDDEGYISIEPFNPDYIYLPEYDPAIVFGPPRPGFAIGAAIRFRPPIVLGGAFEPWGWAHVGFLWGHHDIVIDHTPWNRIWINRGFYVHPYAHPWIRPPGLRIEVHRGPRPH
jgi:Protein of unknown function (DUF3300)